MFTKENLDFLEFLNKFTLKSTSSCWLVWVELSLVLYPDIVWELIILLSLEIILLLLFGLFSTNSVNEFWFWLLL